MNYGYLSDIRRNIIKIVCCHRSVLLLEDILYNLLTMQKQTMFLKSLPNVVLF